VTGDRAREEDVLKLVCREPDDGDWFLNHTLFARLCLGEPWLDAAQIGNRARGVPLTRWLAQHLIDGWGTDA
jgi:hypothetical protein